MPSHSSKIFIHRFAQYPLDSYTFRLEHSKVLLALITVGVATWVAAMSSGHFVVLLSGIPASSGLLNGFLVPFLLVLGSRAIPTKWSITIAFTVYGALSIPVLLLGPPGIQKLFVAFFAGLIADLLLRLFSKLPKHLAYLLAFSFWGASLAFLARIAFYFLDLPGKEKFLGAFWAMTVVFVVGAALGSYFASVLFDKKNIGDYPIVKGITDSQN